MTLWIKRIKKKDCSFFQIATMYLLSQKKNKFGSNKREKDIVELVKDTNEDCHEDKVEKRTVINLQQG